MKNANLLPCPICYNPNLEVSEHISVNPSKRHYFVVKCSFCSLSSFLFDSYNEAVEGWNSIERKDQVFTVFDDTIKEENE